jgi:hypothetical protein
MKFLIDFDCNFGESDDDIEGEVGEGLADIPFEDFVDLIESFDDCLLELLFQASGVCVTFIQQVQQVAFLYQRHDLKKCKT